MTDYRDIQRIRQLDNLCNLLGFRYDKDRYDFSSNQMALYATELLTVYDLESPLCSGNVEDLLKFLQGWEKAHQYLNVLGAITPKSIERKRQDYRNKKLVKAIKGKNSEQEEV